MGMTEKHYRGIGEVLARNIRNYPHDSPEQRALIKVCHDLGTWINSLRENPRYKVAQFVVACGLRPDPPSDASD
jgi:hypothetical protein